jgi:hypothetical protein
MATKKAAKVAGIVAADLAIIFGGASLINNNIQPENSTDIIPNASNSPKTIYYSKGKSQSNYSVVLNPAPAGSSTSPTLSPTPSAQASASAQPSASSSASAPSVKPTPLVTQTLNPITMPPTITGVTSASGSTYVPAPGSGGGTGNPSPRPTRTPTPRPTYSEHEGNDH